MVFVRMGQWEEAISTLEYIMNEEASHHAGLHLVVCCRATEDRDRMRSAFSLLLSIPLDVEDEEKYNLDQVRHISAVLIVTLQFTILTLILRTLQKMLFWH